MTKKEIQQRLNQLYKERDNLRLEAVDEWKALDRRYPEREALTQTKEYRELKQRGQELINKMFATMKDGERWIKAVHKQGKETYRCVSMFGAVRHLWGYMHNNNALHGMMNRRGPNSIIQGPSSNIVYTGCRELQKLNHKCSQLGFPLGYTHTNVVHDSNEAESNILTLPLTLYYVEHALTTLVSRKLRDVYGFELPIGLELAIEIGASHDRMTKWDGTEHALLQIVEAEIDWQIAELGYKLDKAKILRAVKHNARVVGKYRLQELEKHGNSIKPEYEMLLTPNKLDAANLIWRLDNNVITLPKKRKMAA